MLVQMIYPIKNWLIKRIIMNNLKVILKENFNLLNTLNMPNQSSEKQVLPACCFGMNIC